MICFVFTRTQNLEPLRHYLEDDYMQQVVDIFMIGYPTSYNIKKSDESLDVKFFKFKDLPDNMVPTLKKLSGSTSVFTGLRRKVF